MVSVVVTWTIRPERPADRLDLVRPFPRGDPGMTGWGKMAGVTPR